MIPEGLKRKLAVEVQPSGAQPNFVTTDPSQISITSLADGIQVTSLGAGKGPGGVPGVPEIQATDGTTVFDRVGFFILPPQRVSVGYHFMSDPPRGGLLKNLPILRTCLWSNRAQSRRRSCDDKKAQRSLGATSEHSLHNPLGGERHV